MDNTNNIEAIDAFIQQNIDIVLASDIVSKFVNLLKETNTIAGFRNALSIFSQFGELNLKFVKALQNFAELSVKNASPLNILKKASNIYLGYTFDMANARRLKKKLIDAAYIIESDDSLDEERKFLKLRGIWDKIASLTKFENLFGTFKSAMIDFLRRYVARKVSQMLITYLMPLMLILLCFTVFLAAINSFKEDPVGAINKYCPRGSCTQDMIQFLKNRVAN
jgi:hypothetical protein